MRKKLAIMMSLALLASTPLAACGGGSSKGSNANTATDIEIFYWKSGLGTEWIEKVVEGFEAKHPEYNVMLEYTSDGSYIDSSLPLGGGNNTIDLYFTARGNNTVKYCEPLNDVLTMKNDGETKTIGEKIGENKVTSLTSNDGNIYALTYTDSWGALCYDADVIDGTTYSVPNTTNELYYLTMDLASEGYVPFIGYKSGGYWGYMYKVWMAQYFGTDAYLDMMNNPTKEKLCNDNNGMYETLKVLESLIGPSSQYYNGSNSLDFTSAQTLFLEKEAVMMVNGSWMEYEMKGNYEEGSLNVRMMKNPVISSIIDQLATVSDDTELSALIDAIDAGSRALSGEKYDVSFEDYNRVYEARNLMFNTFSGHAVTIPKYSNAKEGAKEFIKYFYSDEALLTYTNTLHVSAPAEFDNATIKIDTSTWSDWAKEQYELAETNIVFDGAGITQHKIFTEGGCSLWGPTEIIRALSANNAADKKTANELWTATKQKHNDSWEQYLKNAGVTE